MNPCPRPTTPMNRRPHLGPCLALLLALSPLAQAENAPPATSIAGSPGTAQATTVTAAAGPSTADRFERFNRSVYAFNTGLDRAIVRPVARGYAHLPGPIRSGVGNFLGNLAYPNTILNDFLQGKWQDGARDLARFAINSVAGVGGLMDPATRAGLVRNDEDFGQTLGKWGVPSGPYLMLPILGPSTLRDAPTWGVDYLTDLRTYIDTDAVSGGLAVLRVVDTRTDVLVADAAVEQAFDPYAFVRDAYLQRREYKVHDGDVPSSPEEPLEDPAAD